MARELSEYKSKFHTGASGFGGLGVCMLASGTKDRGFAPDRSRRIFPAGKIHSMQYDTIQKTI
jgi:hypothetical protein